MRNYRLAHSLSLTLTFGHPRRLIPIEPPSSALAHQAPELVFIPMAFLSPPCSDLPNRKRRPPSIVDLDDLKFGRPVMSGFPSSVGNGTTVTRFCIAPLFFEPSMDHLCDFCTEQRPVVYCQSDTASLCLSCDRNVHSANALSWRHLRTLLCDQCIVQPAAVRCIEENKSLCGNCDRKVHGGLDVASEHNRHMINCYSGCPSAPEFSRIWSFLECLHVTDSDYEQGFMITNEDSVTNCGEPREDSSDANIGNTWKMNDKTTIDKCNFWKGSSSASEIPMFYSADQPANPVNSTTPKSYCPATNDTGFSKADFDEGFTIGDVDIIFENYEELFGADNKQTKDLFDDAGIDSFYDRKKSSPTCSLYNGELAAEASSAGQVKQMQILCNDAVSADSVMSKPDGDPDCDLAFQECKEASHCLRLAGNLLLCVTRKRKNHANLIKRSDSSYHTAIAAAAAAVSSHQWGSDPIEFLKTTVMGPLHLARSVQSALRTRAHNLMLFDLEDPFPDWGPTSNLAASQQQESPHAPKKETPTDVEISLPPPSQTTALQRNGPLAAASPRLRIPGRTIQHLHTECSKLVIHEIKILA
ncbi:hypothetical protein OPV22_005281 [Ensete ventricosum]|uniref:B box-type domain-containing protein n=1 Tax=Ensete ventricosum TaxID=4639 RepID=A0AAV8RNT2_ENSVE|nr:hypothetical protein OPV22_005281 [Ensete ventricosum]